jgi:group I intron endonuclease
MPHPENIIPPKKGIYKISFIGSDKIYVGSAINLNKRYNNHLSDLRKNRHCNAIMQRSYNKYGIDKFIFEVLEIVDNKNKLINIEQYYIDKLNQNMNILKIAFSSLGLLHSEKTKQIMSEKAKKRKNQNIQYLQTAPLKKQILVMINGVKTVYESILKFEVAIGMNGANGSLRRKLLSKGNHYLKKYNAEISYV